MMYRVAHRWCSLMPMAAATTTTIGTTIATSTIRLARSTWRRSRGLVSVCRAGSGSLARTFVAGVSANIQATRTRGKASGPCNGNTESFTLIGSKNQARQTSSALIPMVSNSSWGLACTRARSARTAVPRPRVPSAPCDTRARRPLFGSPPPGTSGSECAGGRSWPAFSDPADRRRKRPHGIACASVSLPYRRGVTLRELLVSPAARTSGDQSAPRHHRHAIRDRGDAHSRQKVLVVGRRQFDLIIDGGWRELGHGTGELADEFLAVVAAPASGCRSDRWQPCRSAAAGLAEPGGSCGPRRPVTGHICPDGITGWLPVRQAAPRPTADAATSAPTLPSRC